MSKAKPETTAQPVPALPFGTYVREQRKAAGMTASAMAESVGLSVSYWSRVENNIQSPPKDEILHKVASLLGLSSKALFQHAGRRPDRDAVPLDPDRPAFGTFMRQKRRSAGLTIKEFAASIGCSTNHWTQIELGKQPPTSDDLVQNAANELGIKMADAFLHAGRLPPGKTAMTPDAVAVDQAMTFGAFIRQHRERRGLTIIDFARQIAISPAYWSRVEIGKERPPKDSLILKAAEVLGVATDDAFVHAGRLPPDMVGSIGEVVALWRARH